MTDTEAWLALLGLGAFHGINPGMGWLFSVALGLQEQRRAAVLRALVPIALGHALSIGIVVLTLVLLQDMIDDAWLRWPVGIMLAPFGAYKLVRARPPRWGATRFHSVKNGLKQVKEKGIVAVQDACRPFANEKLLMSCLETVMEKGTAIPAIDIKDSIREVVKDGSRHRNRMRFKAVQTPQCFDATVLKDAYRQTFSESFTDDASVVEAAGTRIHLVDGDPGNFKITTHFDLLLAEKIMKCDS